MTARHWQDAGLRLGRWLRKIRGLRMQQDQEVSHEPSPWLENAVRLLEEGPDGEET